MSDRWKVVDVPGSAVRNGCLNCSPRPGMLRYRDNPSPGFGIVTLKRDGESLAVRYGSSAEAIRRWRAEARNAPDHDWAIEVETPMVGVRYTRMPSGRWLATHRSIGFA